MKRTLLSLAVASFCLVAASQAYAEAPAASSDPSMFCGRFYFAPEVLGFFPEKKAVKDSTFVGAAVGYDFTENFAAEVESGWVGFDIRSSGNKLATLNNTPLLINARYNIMGQTSPWDIFVLGGMGVAYNSFSVEGSQLSGKSQSGTFAAQVGGGAEYRFTENMSISADVRYYWNDPRARVVSGPAESSVLGGIKADSFAAGGAFTYKF